MKMKKGILMKRDIWWLVFGNGIGPTTYNKIKLDAKYDGFVVSING